MDSALQAVLVFVFAIIILGGIGTIIHFTMSGYKSLEHQNKSELQNFIDGVIGFFKIFRS